MKPTKRRLGQPLDRQAPEPHRILEALFLQAYPFARRAAEVRSAAAVARNSEMDKEDLEQDALLGVWLAIGGYDSSRAALRTFVERIVATKVASALRRISASKRTPPTHMELEECVDLFVRVDLRVDIERALRKLRKKDKKVARLLSECTPAEVARALGIRRQAVHRSMERIRVALCTAGIGEFL